MEAACFLQNQQQSIGVTMASDKLTVTTQYPHAAAENRIFLFGNGYLLHAAERDVTLDNLTSKPVTVVPPVIQSPNSPKNWLLRLGESRCEEFYLDNVTGTL